MGFRGQYHPVHIVCDMDRVRSNMFWEKNVNFENFMVSWHGLEPGLTPLLQRSNPLTNALIDNLTHSLALYMNALVRYDQRYR